MVPEHGETPGVCLRGTTQLGVGVLCDAGPFGVQTVQEPHEVGQIRGAPSLQGGNVRVKRVVEEFAGVGVPPHEGISQCLPGFWGPAQNRAPGFVESHEGSLMVRIIGVDTAPQGNKHIQFGDCLSLKRSHAQVEESCGLVLATREQVLDKGAWLRSTEYGVAKGLVVVHDNLDRGLGLGRQQHRVLHGLRSQGVQCHTNARQAVLGHGWDVVSLSPGSPPFEGPVRRGLPPQYQNVEIVWEDDVPVGTQNLDGMPVGFKPRSVGLGMVVL